jgi:hypothetical protein
MKQNAWEEFMDSLLCERKVVLFIDAKLVDCLWEDKGQTGIKSAAC